MIGNTYDLDMDKVTFNQLFNTTKKNNDKSNNKKQQQQSRVRHAFMKTGGNALHSPFIALNGQSTKLRKHEESFGFDEHGKWKHESAKDRVAYLKVTKRPPTYFSPTGGLSLFYLDGRDENGRLIKDISKQQTHIHGEKFTNKIMKQRIKKQIQLERSYKKKTGIKLGNNIAKYLDLHRNTNNNNNNNNKTKQKQMIKQTRTSTSNQPPSPSTKTKTTATDTTKDNNQKWIVFPSIEIEYVKHEAMARRLKKLSQKNSMKNNGFVNEIKRLKEKSAMAESQYMPYYDVNIPKPHNLYDSMPIPVMETFMYNSNSNSNNNNNNNTKNNEMEKIKNKLQTLQSASVPNLHFNSSNKTKNTRSTKKNQQNIQKQSSEDILDEDEFEFVINKNINQQTKYNNYKEGSAESFNIHVGGNLQSFVRSKSYPTLKALTRNPNNNNKNNTMNILPQNNNTYNKMITTPITPLARSISSGLTMLHDKMKNILEEMIHEITDNLKQRDEDTKYERRFGKKRTGALSNKPTDIEMALDLLSNKFIKKFEHDPHFDIAWGRIAGEKEEE